MDRLARIMEMLRATPDDNFLQHALALEYIKSGNDAAARTVFETILQRDPAYVGSYYHLARLLVRTGETTLALAWYEKGMEVAKTVGDNHSLAELRAAYEDLVEG